MLPARTIAKTYLTYFGKLYCQAAANERLLLSYLVNNGTWLYRLLSCWIMRLG